jgi:hypothetical protein
VIGSAKLPISTAPLYNTQVPQSACILFNRLDLPIFITLNPTLV